ncbi:MAG: pyridoxal-phosphate dependent enzyme [Armatimonadota bacterium]|nr:pyridoxal-phosphate dependent enzyme [Armatimonadota bacterium]
MVATTLTPADLRGRIAQHPRVKLAFLPTPIQRCANLSRDLGVDLWVKRDDLTGPAFGGNKMRNLEWRMAEAMQAGADVLVFGVEATSNSARQTTAAANMLGLPLVLVLRGKPESEPQGNLLCDLILGAEVRLLDLPTYHDLSQAVQDVVTELRAKGRRPWSLNHGKMFRCGAALATVENFLEILELLGAQGRRPEHIYISSGGKGLAGLMLARKALGLPVRIVGIASTANEDPWQSTAEIASETAALLGLPVTVTPGEVEASWDYIGPGYGIPTPEGMDAVLAFARREGILLDPTYTGKAAAGMLDHIRRGIVPQGATVVFVHTGGQPALFAQSRALMEHMTRRESHAQPVNQKGGRV